MRAATWLTIVLLVGVAHAAPPASSLTDDARAALDALQYSDAVKLVERAWARGEAGPPELRALFMLAGRAAASLGDKAGARTWFGRLLALDPEAKLPRGTSPKLVALFLEARDGLTGAKLAARAVQRGREIVVTVESDPVEIAEAVRIGEARAELIDGVAALRGRAAGSQEVPVELLDAHGNVLAILELRTIAAREEAPVVAKTRTTPFIQTWPVWAIATAGLAAVGGGGLWFAVDARNDINRFNADPSQHQGSDVAGYYRRFDNSIWVSRIALGGAAVTAVIGTVFYVRSRGESRISVAPTGDGARASWSVTF